VVAVYARNTTPVNVIQIPIEYDGTLDLAFDSFSTSGCRTSYFDAVVETDSDKENKRSTISIWNYGTGTPDLEAGSGAILRLFFSASQSPIPERTARICVDGYLAKLPFLGGSSIQEYSPIAINGILEGLLCGDANGNGSVNIQDLTFLINYLYKGGPAPDPSQAGDPNGSGIINIQDITFLINFLYKSGSMPMCL
jgi:Dockerin type I domain